MTKLLWLLVMFLFLEGCESPQILVRKGTDWSAKAADEILRENPLRNNENIRVIPLNTVSSMSCSFVIIREREKPHKHQNHDLTVVIQKGQGSMYLDQKKFSIRKGDVLFIPRGMPHYFVNTGEKPAVAYCVFSPAYDGKDMILLNDESSP